MMDKKSTKSTSHDKITVSNNVSENNISKSSKDRTDRLWTTIATSIKTVKESTLILSKPKEVPKKSRLREKGDCDDSKSSSHTKYYKQNQYLPEVYKKITLDQYMGVTSSTSGTSDTFHCKHPEGRTFSETTLLKRNLEKVIDPIPIKLKSKDECPPYFDWNLAKTLSFLVKDPVGPMQIERIVVHLKDFSVLSNTGFKIDALDDVCIILDFLYESLNGPPEFREGIISILENCAKPILLNVNSDIVTYFDSLRNFIGYLGYLLMRSEDDDIFDMVSKALVWQMSAPNSKRGIGTARLQQILAASAKVLYQTSVRMLAIATPHRFPAYLDIVFLLACDSVDNCLDLMEENIFENIFYRFNPYFPEKPLPLFEINPDLDSIYLKLGASTVHMSTTLSLLLVLLQTMKNYVADHPDYAKRLPCPDDYAQRCFIWAYRYECRARGHRHERITMTVISNVLLHIFGERLATFCNTLMQDVLTLSVVTELPPLNDWTRTVNFNPSQQDVQFKKMLIYLSVDFFKTCPQNTWMAEHLHWVTGLMYLIDPGLCSLRTNWTAVLFSELRKVVLQAFTIVLPKINKSISSQHNIIRRIMWYIEWYSESPFELALLYWCVRVLQTCMSTRGTKAREDAIEVMFNSHGLIILLQLVYKLLEQKTPPLEKVQVIIAVILRILTSTTIRQKTVSCCVYPQLKWPLSINKLGNKMLRIVLRSLEKHCIVSNRWMISLLTFIWHAVVWKDEYRNMFIANKGVYQLLDLVTLTCYPVQCVALGLLVDIAYAGEAVSQLVTWRAGMQADPNLVTRGATIASLLAAIFKKDCEYHGISLDDNCVIQELNHPLMSKATRENISAPEFKDFHKHISLRTPMCLAAAELGGSRMSRAYALLHILSEDLEYKVTLADEAYKLYKNIELTPQDECMLVACSHFLTLKLNETWYEAEIQIRGLVSEDEKILNEFLHFGRGWAIEVHRQQLAVLERVNRKERDQEARLYEFLSRVRLNIALDALRQVRCIARATDREQIAHTLIFEAIHAYHRRSTMSKKLDSQVIRTYSPPLDEQHVPGQYKRIITITPNEKLKLVMKES